ncbi:MAG: hypothetical protein HQK50_05420 [Oligoflexia bacterium]|nr:hypothetical protein [Oligoflexia bacterium]
MKYIFLLVTIFPIITMIASCKSHNESRLASSESAVTQTKGCPGSMIYDDQFSSCREECNPGMYFDYTKKKCINITVPTTEMVKCQGEQISDAALNICTCSGNAKVDPNSYRCLCSAGERYERGKGCVSICVGDDIFYPQYKLCAKKCDSGKFYDPEIADCKSECGKDEKFIPWEKRCVPVCKGNSYWIPGQDRCIEGLPLKVFYGMELLTKLLADRKQKLPVCLISYKNNPLSAEQQSILSSNIKKAFQIWLAPLRTFAHRKFVDEVEVKIVFDDCKNMDRLFELIMYPGSGASASFKDIAIGNTIISNLATYIHELGHVFGFDDHYNFPDEAIPIDLIGRPCHRGYDASTTVMCVDEAHLKPADEEGIKRRYCNFFPEDSSCNGELKKLTDFDNGEFLKCPLEDPIEKIVIKNDKYLKSMVHLETKWGTIPNYVTSSPPQNLELADSPFDHFIWKLNDPLGMIKPVHVDFFRNKITGELTDDHGVTRIINSPLYKIIQERGVTKLEWNCEVNSFIKYRAMRKLKNYDPLRFTNLVWTTFDGKEVPITEGPLESHGQTASEAD